MISSLTTKPLLILVAILSVTTAGLAWHVANLYTRLGECRSECELRISNISAERSQATTDLITESLRHQVTILEAELQRLRDANKEIARRHGAAKELLNEYERQLNEARKTDLTLDQPADTSRLRALEDAYRVRAQGSGGVPVPSDP